jgi:hypothetical protein
MSAFLMAGESFTPSPVTATIKGIFKLDCSPIFVSYSFTNFKINSVALNPFITGMSQSIKII